MKYFIVYVDQTELISFQVGNFVLESEKKLNYEDILSIQKELAGHKDKNNPIIINFIRLD